MQAQSTRLCSPVAGALGEAEGVVATAAAAVCGHVTRVVALLGGRRHQGCSHGDTSHVGVIRRQAQLVAVLSEESGVASVSPTRVLRQTHRPAVGVQRQVAGCVFAHRLHRLAAQKVRQCRSRVRHHGFEHRPRRARYG